MSVTRPNARTLARAHRTLTSQVRNYAAPGEGTIPAAKKKYVPTSGTYPLGFRVGSAHVGVKPSNTRFDDLALITSDKPCSAAAVFTTNKFQAAPVTVSRDVLKKRKGEGIRAVVVNSGCANAVTGKGGIEDAITMGKETDRCFSRDTNGAADDPKGGRSLVMSTGVIGQRLPIQKIVSKLPNVHDNLGTSHDHWLSAARAICTTDTFPKLLSRTFKLPDRDEEYHIAGMTKGAGMIHPNMATLLGIICTDVPISGKRLHSILGSVINKSFNCISIDGDTSTNDTVAVLANGAAGGEPISHQKTVDAFQKVLTSFATDLAKLVVRDGEGATKFVTIRVTNAKSTKHAKAVANSIAKSPLVKTALYGKDANWGRILCATGYADLGNNNSIIPEETSVSFIPADGSAELKLLVNGEPEAVDEKRAAQILEQEDLEIVVRLSNPERGRKVHNTKYPGPSYTDEATVWTCDFSHEYVTINGDYRT
jgi:glutamate N-acetyltransferase/amino-acid N-acetyltransferase